MVTMVRVERGRGERSAERIGDEAHHHEQERGLEPDGRWPLTASLSVRRARRQDRKATPKLRTRLSLAWFDLIRLSLTSSRPPIRCQSVAARPSVSRYTP